MASAPCEPVSLKTRRPAERANELERNAQNFAIPTPRFARKFSTWNPPSHADGPYPQNCMVELSRNQASETHFDKFADPSMFQCFKTSFKTEVCSCSSFPTETMLWIKEVEVAEPVDDLKTSQSIVGYRFPNFEMLDAKIVCFEEDDHTSPLQEESQSGGAKGADARPILRVRQIASAIYEYCRITGARGGVLDFTDLFSVKVTIFKILIPDGTKLYYLQVKCPRTNVLYSLYKMRIRESVQLQRVLAIYEQEVNQCRSRPSYQKSKTIVRRHTGQMIRTRNFTVRNEIEIGVLVESQGNKSGLKGDKEKCYQWKAKGQCSEEHCLQPRPR